VESVGRPAKSSQPAFHERDATNFARFRAFERRFDSANKRYGLEQDGFRVSSFGVRPTLPFRKVTLREG
jgi:hypothetical protein